MSDQQPPPPGPGRPRRITPAMAAVGAVAVALAVLACLMIVRGLPQQTATQRWLLDLSSLPLSAAVALLVARLVVERGMLRDRPDGAPLPRLFLAGIVLVAVGLTLWVLVLAGIRLPVINPVGAQAVLWLGLGSWCLWVLTDGRRRDRAARAGTPDEPFLSWRAEPDDD